MQAAAIQFFWFSFQNHSTVSDDSNVTETHYDIDTFTRHYQQTGNVITPVVQ